MRTTVTLDDDVEKALRRAAGERGTSFKVTINEVLRAGLSTEHRPRPYEVPSRAMGVRPGLDLDRALALAGDLEDEETVRRLELRK